MLSCGYDRVSVSRNSQQLQVSTQSLHKLGRMRVQTVWKKDSENLILLLRTRGSHGCLEKEG